jgi:signal transduction histidine kinase
MADMDDIEKLSERIRRLEKHNAQLFLIADASRRISEALDSKAIVKTLLQVCKELTGATKCFFLSSRWKCFELNHELRETDLGDLKHIYDRIESEKKAVVDKGNGTVLGMPLIYEGRVIGAVVVAEIPFPEHVEEYISAISLITGPVAIALENVFLMEHFKESASFVKTIIDSIGDPLLVINPNTYRIELANKAAMDLLDGKDPVAMSMHCYQLSHQRDTPCEGVDEKCPLKEVVSSKAPVRITHIHRDARGQEHYMDIIATPVLDRDGNVAQVIETIREITELKKYAWELERSNRLKDLFTDIMRHDLLNPAGVVRGAAELLLDETPDREELKIIKRSVDKLISMIESASKLSKLESVEKLEKECLDLKEIIARVVEENKTLMEKAGLRVENNVRESIMVLANPVIEDIFLNFFSNAAKYAAGGRKVVIDAVEEDGWVKVMVKDYGPGIPDEAKEDIFVRFERREKEGVKGTGLGLAIAKRIVELHDGEIWVEDNPEGGSIFVVKLPKAPK